MSLTLGELRALLDERESGYSDNTVVQATTPHQSYTFEILYLSGTLNPTARVSDVVTLHLVEVPA